MLKCLCRLPVHTTCTSAQLQRHSSIMIVRSFKFVSGNMLHIPIASKENNNDLLMGLYFPLRSSYESSKQLMFPETEVQGCTLSLGNVIMDHFRFWVLRKRLLLSGVSVDFLKVKFPVVTCHVLTVYFLTYMFTVCS